MSVNKVILVGNLGKDPEVRFTGSGKAVAKFPIATSEQWSDAEGGRQERTEWHNIVVWGKQGETCGQYLSKGRQVYVEGSIRSHSYDDKDGNKRYMTEIIAQRVRFLGGGERGAGAGAGASRGGGGGGSGGGGGGGGGGANVGEPPAFGPDPGTPSDDDDIPF